MNARNIFLIMIITCCVLIELFLLYEFKLSKKDEPINSITLDSMKNWPKRFKDHEKIPKLIKEALEDGVITRSEYNKILELVVEENEKHVEKEKDQIIQQMIKDLNLSKK